MGMGFFPSNVSSLFVIGIEEDHWYDFVSCNSPKIVYQLYFWWDAASILCKES